MTTIRPIRPTLAGLGLLILAVLAAAPLQAQLLSAVDDAYNVERGSAFQEPAPGVLLNDCCAKTEPLTARLAGPPASGSLTLNPDGSFTYVHDGSAGTIDSFTYEALEGSKVSNVATVTLNLFEPAKPEAVNDTYQVEVGSLLVVDVAQGLLSNDTDPQGDPLSVVSVNGSAAAVGVSIALPFGDLTVAADGSFSYAHDGSPLTGDPETFTYRASDGTNTSAAATVTLFITNPTTQNNTEFIVTFSAIERVGRSTWLTSTTNEQIDLITPSAQFAQVAGPTGFPFLTSWLSMSFNDAAVLDKGMALFSDCQRQALLVQARPGTYVLEVYVLAPFPNATEERIDVRLDDGVVKCTLRKLASF